MYQTGCVGPILLYDSSFLFSSVLFYLYTLQLSKHWPMLMAMLAIQPNQAEVKNVETSDLRARYMIPIKLKPRETLGMRHYFF